MSNARRHRRQIARGRTPAKQVIATARLGAILAGCTCQPDFTITRHQPGVSETIIGHDDDCPAISHGTQWMLTLP